MSSSKDNLYGKSDPTTTKPTSNSKRNPMTSKHSYARATDEPERDPQTNVDNCSEPNSEPNQGVNSSNRCSTASSSPLNGPNEQRSNDSSQETMVPSSQESSLESLDSSFEQIWIAKPDAPLMASYSEQTVKQIGTIKLLVDEQEKETQEKLDKQRKESGGEEDKLPVSETSFAKAIDEIREVIRIAYEELQEEEMAKKANLKDGDAMTGEKSQDKKAQPAEQMATTVKPSDNNNKKVSESVKPTETKAKEQSPSKGTQVASKPNEQLTESTKDTPSAAVKVSKPSKPDGSASGHK